jgi:hypothetical protein
MKYLIVFPINTRGPLKIEKVITFHQSVFQAHIYLQNIRCGVNMLLEYIITKAFSTNFYTLNTTLTRVTLNKSIENGQKWIKMHAIIS